MNKSDKPCVGADVTSSWLAATSPPTSGAVLRGNNDQRNSGLSSAALVIAALIVGVGAVTASLIYTGRESGPQTSEQSRPPGTSASGAAGISSPNCQSWVNTRQQIEAIPNLPAGWNWDMPNIDTYVSNRNTALAKSLDLLDADVKKRPVDNVTEAAGQYTAAWRSTIRRMSERKSSAIDDDVLEATYKALNSVCGLS